MATSRKPYDAMAPHVAAPNRPMDQPESAAASTSEESESASASHRAIWLDSVSISVRIPIPPRVATAAAATGFLAKPPPPLAPLVMSSSSSSSSQGGGRRRPMSRALIEQHRPWDVVDNMALIIIDQTYAAALGIPGRREMGDGSVEVSSAVDADDPDSPFTSPKRKTRPDHRLARTIVSVSPATLYLSHRSDCVGGDSDSKDYWSCAEVAPDVAAGGALAILDTIMLRLEAAIHLEENILVNAMEFNCGTSSVLEVVAETRNALEEMRREMDLPEMMQRRLHKRRHVVVGDAAAADHDDESAEKVFKKFRTMRCR
ncbi:hypothetical protein OsJ_32334 [Oryza sativa Japonica Group]|uniref:Uncharacterized protein n=1 Tax=Oryza sativa subsp. japonica TaxID=39947 RepID=B9G6U1_ORYSJ|nr:hypothetical protein OsJ_32334 [Oryza sativa Japonica Group]